MIESRKACRKLPYHQQKLYLILTAMREFADELRAQGRTVIYKRLEDEPDDWFDALGKICEEQNITSLYAMRSSDRAPQARLEQWAHDQKITLRITPNELFLTSQSEFSDWAETQKRYYFEMFYRWQRKRLGILLENGKPLGGTWNLDAQNRQPLKPDVSLPALPQPPLTQNGQAVQQLIKEQFADHPGNLDEQWLPVNHAQAVDWLDDFIINRLMNFGPYEDAMAKGESFLFHSALSPLLNIGLLHPSEIVQKALAADVSLNSKEGFIRQIIGWREFVFGMYHFMPYDWRNSNFFNNQQKLPEWWWRLEGAPEPPLQDVLSRLARYGYSHHIERLMVLGNYMLLHEYDPNEVYRWFMSMYVDAYDWVMVPNVIGMSQFADGGLDNGGFATKPYISGSNYLQKMGRWWPSQKAAQASTWTAQYWHFLESHYSLLANNHRLRPLLARFKKSD